MFDQLKIFSGSIIALVKYLSKSFSLFYLWPSCSSASRSRYRQVNKIPEFEHFETSKSSLSWTRPSTWLVSGSDGWYNFPRGGRVSRRDGSMSSNDQHIMPFSLAQRRYSSFSPLAGVRIRIGAKIKGYTENLDCPYLMVDH